MSITDVTARIAQIQAQLIQFDSSTTSTSNTGFASSLATARAATDSGTTTGTTGTGSSVAGDAVVADARKYLGVPYVWGGTDPKKGLDCSGLVQLVYKDLGYTLPRVASDQAQAGQEVQGGLANARPGDLLAFGSPVHHIAIYLGGNKMIEAPRPGKDVRISDVYETPTHVRRIIAGDDTMVTPANTPTTRVATSTPYAGIFNSAAVRYGVPAALLSAVAKQESGYNPSAVSPVGAQGLMQLMPGTAKGLGVTDAFDPAQAVDAAARMLRDLTRRFGSTDLALAAYNAGPGAVMKYHGIPPYPETQRYVRDVLTSMKAAS